MNKPNISTVIVIICILIIGLYVMGEVNYFSAKAIQEKDHNSPKIIIPTIGVEETINNVSLNQGVLSDPGKNIPTHDPLILYGHRTLQGSPFLRLNEIKNNDIITIEWPEIGEVNYSVVNTTIVPSTYTFYPKGANSIYLITCDPIGSTENRLIVEGELIHKSPVNDEILQNNPQEFNGLIISAIFLIAGLILSYLYPENNRMYILITVIIISIVLFYCCINPIPSQEIFNKINFLNGGL